MTLLQKVEFAAFLLFWSFLNGCAPCTPAQQAKLDKLECQVHALAPLVEPALDATELVRDLYTGKADMGRVLGSLGATEREVETLVKALRACEPEPELQPMPPEYQPTKLIAPPPAYGNKVI